MARKPAPDDWERDFADEMLGDAETSPERQRARPSSRTKFGERVFTLFGQVFRVLFYIILLTAIWTAWDTPSAFNVPLAQLTMSELIAALFSAALKGAIMLFLGWCLFNPSRDPDAREGWSGLAVFTIIAGALAVYLGSR